MSKKYLLNIRSIAQKLYLLLPPPQETTLRNLVRRDRKGMNISVSTPNTPLEQGRIELQKSAFAEALIQFEIATKKNPQNNWAWHGKGDAFQFLGDYSCAQQAYEQAIRLSENIGLHYGGLANALRAQNQLQKAAEMWKKALDLDPSLVWMRPSSS